MAKILLIVGFAIAFGAGWMMSSGFERRQRQEQQSQASTATAPTTRPGRRGFLASELSLTTEQNEKMKVIWSDMAHRGGREEWDRRNLFRKERDEAIAALIRPEDKEKLDQVQKSYAEKNAAMDKEMRASYETAVEKTREILAPEQLKKYEEFLKNHEPPKGPREHDQGRRVEDRATSQPKSDK
jgi:hypothetical protein